MHDMDRPMPIVCRLQHQYWGAAKPSGSYDIRQLDMQNAALLTQLLEKHYCAEHRTVKGDGCGN